MGGVATHFRRCAMTINAPDATNDDRKRTLDRLLIDALAELRAQETMVPGAKLRQRAIEAKQPVFLVGGFGGCARTITEAIGLSEPWRGSCDTWCGRDRFDGRSAAYLNNGLTPAESRELASTQHVDHPITLVMKGLRRSRKRKRSFRSKAET